jgi:putative membrane protein
MEMLKLLPMSRATFVMDFVVVALIVLLPILYFSIFSVRLKRNIQLHRKLQIGLGVVLGLAITAFELDVRITGWRHLAEPSPYYDTWVFPALIVHLIFAIPTLLIWVFVIVTAIKAFTGSGFPVMHVSRHKLVGRSAALGLTMTSLTGWVFFWLAFIAT